MSKLEVSARMTVRDGQLEGFERQAAAIIRETKERDTKTLRYEWFLSSNQTECDVREAYESSEGLIEYRMHVGEALDKLFREFADGHAVTIYGDPSPQLLEIATSHKDVSVKWYSPLLQTDDPGRGSI